MAKITKFFPILEMMRFFRGNDRQGDTAENQQEGLLEVYKRLRPGEPPTVENASMLVESLSVFDHKRYDLAELVAINLIKSFWQPVFRDRLLQRTSSMPRRANCSLLQVS